MLDSVKNTCLDYYNDIPSGSFRAIAKSALFSFSLTYYHLDRLNAYDLRQPLINGGVAAVATCIYSLTAPIFNYTFGDNRILFHRELLKYMVTHTLTTMMYVAALSGKVSITALPFFVLIPANVFLSISNTLLFGMDYVDPQLVTEFRKIITFLGLDAPPGSASVHLVLAKV